MHEYRARMQGAGGVQQVFLLLLRASVGSALFGGVYAWPHCMLYEHM